MGDLTRLISYLHNCRENTTESDSKCTNAQIRNPKCRKIPKNPKTQNSNRTKSKKHKCGVDVNESIVINLAGYINYELPVTVYVPGRNPAHFIAPAKIKKNIKYPKPPFPLEPLLALALHNSETGCLHRLEIRSFLRYHFPFYCKNSTLWLKTLCSSKYFKTVNNISHPKNFNFNHLWTFTPSNVHEVEEKVQHFYQKNNLAIRNAMLDPENLELLVSGKLKHEFCHCDNPNRQHDIETTTEEDEVGFFTHTVDPNTVEVSEGNIQQQEMEIDITQNRKEEIDQSHGDIDEIFFDENDSADGGQDDLQNSIVKVTKSEPEFINGDVDVKESETESISTNNLGYSACTLPIIVILPPSYNWEPWANRKFPVFNANKSEHFIATAKIDEMIKYPKPPFAMFSIITLALINCETGCLYASEIFKFIIYHFPYYVVQHENAYSYMSMNLHRDSFKKVGYVSRSRKVKNQWTWSNPIAVQRTEKSVKNIYQKNNLVARNSMFDPENLELLISGNLKTEFCHCENPQEHHRENTAEQGSNNTDEVSVSSLAPDLTISSETMISEGLHDQDVEIEIKEEWIAVDFPDTECARSSNYNKLDEELPTATAIRSSPTIPLSTEQSDLSKIPAIPPKRNRNPIGNKNERLRRKDLRNSFHNLKMLVPEKCKIENCSKVEVLTGASDHIKQLRVLQKRFVQEKLAVKFTNDLLLKRLKQLDPRGEKIVNDIEM